jgi:hypothetical protein
MLDYCELQVSDDSTNGASCRPLPICSFTPRPGCRPPDPVGRQRCETVTKPPSRMSAVLTFQAVTIPGPRGQLGRASCPRRDVREVPHEPLACQVGCCGQRAALLEQVDGTRDDRKAALAAEQPLRPPVEIEHDGVGSPHDEQRRCSHQGKPGLSEIRPASPGDDRGNIRRRIGGGSQRRRCTGRRTEVPAARLGRLGLLPEPLRGAAQALGEQLDVEHVRPIELLVRSE